MGKLGVDELHVWTLALDDACSAREQRLAARTGLRVLLGSYLGIEPREVEIRRGIRGRPELAAVHDLGFNLSHTAGLALFAFGRGRAIGVDVEALDRRAPSAGLIERALNVREASRVARAGPARRTEAFLGYWTVKEAYAKALGIGLALDLREVGVTGRSDRPRLDLPAGSVEWHVWRPSLRPGFVGAVVADGEPWRMRLRELSLDCGADRECEH
ncbi:MAG: 4'-phosphopantetheinyl transferase family protein [Solirubrobacteraceae bacterium]